MFILRLLWYIVRPISFVVAIPFLLIVYMILSIVVWCIEGVKYAQGIGIDEY